MERNISDMSLDGGCICFDFTNTVHSRKEEMMEDYLHTYTDLLQWCRRTGSLPEERIERLQSTADEQPAKAEGVLKQAKKIREVLYGVFSALAARKQPQASMMEQYNKAMRQSLIHLRFYYEHEEKKLDWQQEVVQLEEPLWRILKSAFDIWVQEDLKRIKECESCGWMFLDTSKNNRRRWCNMQSCGSIDKALRYYYRKKKQRQQINKKQ
ncbi:MAG: CGNR zinc finger domain-containing protein [Cytophagales bacterium]|nr:CGNR zinc finger domain-containing protein [Cytophagales bacterium]